MPSMNTIIQSMITICRGYQITPGLSRNQINYSAQKPRQTWQPCEVAKEKCCHLLKTGPRLAPRAQPRAHRGERNSLADAMGGIR